LLRPAPICWAKGMERNDCRGGKKTPSPPLRGRHRGKDDSGVPQCPNQSSYVECIRLRRPRLLVVSKRDLHMYVRYCMNIRTVGTRYNGSQNREKICHNGFLGAYQNKILFNERTRLAITAVRYYGVLCVYQYFIIASPYCCGSRAIQHFSISYAFGGCQSAGQMN